MNKTGTMEGVRTLAGYPTPQATVRLVISLTSNDLGVQAVAGLAH